MTDPAPRASISLLHSETAPATSFVSHAETLEYQTTEALEFIDITAEVQGVVERSAVAFGQLTVFSNHTTAAVVVNEHEPLLLNDLARCLSHFAPAGNYYEHNDFTIRTVNMFPDESANGHSHCQHLLLGSSESIPIHEGRAHLGRFQSIFLVELDHARVRRVHVQAMGVGTGR